MGKSLSFPRTQSNSLGHKKFSLPLGKLNMSSVQLTNTTVATSAKAYTSFCVNGSRLRVNPWIICNAIILVRGTAGSFHFR
jgi:hypothetical protein